ncbi:MAG: hypothetical protein JW791_00305 [Nanoarchaeota archaeon]|nr:hypothetical protein [Nanoarchaeota archaeon]
MVLVQDFVKSESELVKNLNVGVLSAFDAVRYGPKPFVRGLLELFRQYAGVYEPFKRVFKHDSEPFYAVCVGDSHNDVRMGENLELRLKNSVSASKVRVDKVIISRYGESHPRADYNVSSFREVSGIIREGCYDLVISDFDNTLCVDFLNSRQKVRVKNNMERFGNLLPLRLGFGLFTLSDILLAYLKVHDRRFFPESEGSISGVFDAVRETESQLVVNSFAPPNSITGFMNKVKGYNLNFFQNRFLWPSKTVL